MQQYGGARFLEAHLLVFGTVLWSPSFEFIEGEASAIAGLEHFLVPPVCIALHRTAFSSTVYSIAIPAARK